MTSNSLFLPTTFLICWFIHVTLISGVGSLGMRLFRSRPAIRHAIGLTGLVLLLLSPATAYWLPSHPLGQFLASAFEPETNGSAKEKSMYEDQQQKKSGSPAVDADHELPRIDRTDDATSASFTPIEDRSITDSVGQISLIPAAKAVVRVDRGATFPKLADWIDRVITVSLLAWLVGIAVVLTRLVRDVLRVRRLRRQMQTAKINESVLNTVMNATGLRRPPNIVCCESLPTPCLLGWFQTVIALPSELVNSESESHLTNALAHECAHLSRGDHWIHAFQTICRTLYWPHPFVKALDQGISAASEDLCDNVVLGFRDSADYAESLLYCATRFAPPPTLGFLGHHRSLETRVASLLSPIRNRRTRCSPSIHFAAAVGFFILLLFGGGINNRLEFNAVGQEPTPDSKAIGEAVAELESARNNRARISVAGECLDKDRNAIANAEAKLIRYVGYWPSAEIVASTTTDAVGSFEFNEIDVDYERNSKTYGGSTSDLALVVQSEGFATKIVFIAKQYSSQAFRLTMKPAATLSGTVKDADGNMVADALVSLPLRFSPIVGLKSAKTNDHGRFQITDMDEWEGSKGTKRSLMVRHSDHGMSTQWYASVPEDLQITIPKSGIVRGTVIDQVTGKAVPNAPISAQCVNLGGGTWYQTRTDAQGDYELRMTYGHYNIWSELPDRMPIALDSYNVNPDTEHDNADIQMVRGGYVVGHVTFNDTDTTLPAMEVAHYGPARPKSGSAVSASPVKPDGSFRLHVAPGTNYVYVMEKSMSAIVEVEDGKEVPLVLSPGTSEPEFASNRRELRFEDLERLRKMRIERIELKRRLEKLAVGQRDAITRELLERLRSQNADSEQYRLPSWLLTLSTIASIGPEAVPVLIDELDNTNDDRMLRCLGFLLRAIGDRRAIPALIRAIPKLAEPSSSDYGLRTEDPELLAFAQKHDLDKQNRATKYGFGRPVREVFGALHKLSGKNMKDGQMYHAGVRRNDSKSQVAQRARLLFVRKANQWAKWWNELPDHEKPDSSDKTIEPFAAVAVKTKAVPPDVVLESYGATSGAIVSPPTVQGSRTHFVDLDTGRQASLPTHFDKTDYPSAAILKWARELGFDIMGMEVTSSDNQNCYSIRTLGAEVHELPAENWKSWPNGSTLQSLITLSRPATSELIPMNEGQEDLFAHRTFLLITGEKTPVVFSLGVEVRNANLQTEVMVDGDLELQPIAFRKGRRYGYTLLRPAD